MKTLKIAVTGAAGQISYSLLFRLASGEVFGPETRLELRLLELTDALARAEGVAMELADCGFSNLSTVEISDNAEQAFDGVHWALLIGSRPRQAGMERSDLLLANAEIFVGQGRALGRADSEVRVVVVGNPCNTNALIAAHNSPELAMSRFSAMTMLDENRAKAQIACKVGSNVAEIKNLIVWGNHSPTMFPDFENATIGGQKPVVEVCERQWLEGQFTSCVRQRGAEIIKARGSSSAASAANACIDHLKKLNTASPESFSAAVVNDRSRYDVPEGLFYSFPIISDGMGGYQIVENVKLSAYAQQNIAASAKELASERAAVSDFLRK